MFLKPPLAASAALCLLFAAGASADSLSSEEALQLLQMGGSGGAGWADAMATPGWQAGGLFSGPACGKLDIPGGVRDFMERSAAGTEGLRNQAYQSATATISGLPWLTLRRALPEIADLFDAELARAEEKTQHILGRCERESVAPVQDDWQQAARNQAWKIAGMIASTPEQAEDMTQDASKEGVLWLDDTQRGGKDQQPIFVIAETGRAGAEILLSADELRTSGWSSAAEAGEWLAAIVGDIRIHLDESTSNARPGSGLWPQVREVGRTLHPILVLAVDKRRRGEPADEELLALKAGRSGIRPTLLDEISRSHSGWQSQAISRLAYEMAMSHTLDKALLARQFLLTGLQIPQIAALKPAQIFGRERLQQLEAEVQALLFEYRARQSLGSTMGDIWQASRTGSQSH